MVISLNQSKDRKINFLYWITALLLYMSLLPFFVWPIVSYTLYLITIPIICILFANQSKPVDGTSVFSYAMICFIASLCGGSNVFGIVMMIIYSFIFIADNQFFINVYKRYRLIYVFLIALSLISYSLVELGVNLPYRVSPPPPRNSMDFDFYIYPFYACPSVSDWRNLLNARFSGLFDEPGIVGTVSFLILYIEKFNLKKYGNIILLIAGIFSFSLFFYVSVFIVLIYKICERKVKYRTKIVFIVLLIGGGLAISNNEIVKVYIGNRMAWNSKKNSIVGDDRSETELKVYVSKIRGTSEYFWGNPDKARQFRDSASLEKEILTHGFITLLLVFLFYALYSKKYINNLSDWLLFNIVFFMVLYNRPTFFSFERLFLYNMAIYAYSARYSHLFGDNGEKNIVEK